MRGRPMLKRTDEDIAAVLNGTKRCSRCKEVKPTNQFGWIKAREKPRSGCYDCENAAHRANQARRRKQFRAENPSRQTERQEIMALFALGLSRDEVRARGYSVSYVGQLARNYGGPPVSSRRLVSVELIEAIRQAIHTPMAPSLKQIGIGLGISRDKVAGIVWRYGLNDLKEKPEVFVVTHGSRLSRRHVDLARRRHQRHIDARRQSY